MGSGMVYLQHGSCLGNSNHAGAGRAFLSIRTLFRCQSAQEIVRYLALRLRLARDLHLRDRAIVLATHRDPVSLIRRAKKKPVP